MGGILPLNVRDFNNLSKIYSFNEGERIVFTHEKVYLEDHWGKYGCSTDMWRGYIYILLIENDREIKM